MSKIYGHRGLYDNISVFENTEKSFMDCLLNSIGIETDIRLTSDGQVVVIHDHDTKRLYNKDYKVNYTSYHKLKSLKTIDNSKIMLLSEFLELVNGSVPLILEVKAFDYGFNKNEMTKKLNNILKNYKGEYKVISFNHEFLAYYYNVFKDKYDLGLLVSTLPKHFWIDSEMRKKMSQLYYYNPNFMKTLVYDSELFPDKFDNSIEMVYNVQFTEDVVKYKDNKINMILDKHLYEFYKGLV